jgi:polar amino acid transport system permease protein
VALRPFGNELISMIKSSALAAIVTLLDLMGQTRYIFSRTFDFTVYLWAAILYLIMVELIRRLWRVLEARLTRHLVRDTGGKATAHPTPAAVEQPLPTH